MGSGKATPEMVTALAAEMIRIASDLGEPEDPFAAWENTRALPAAPAWQPIATAPRDGTRFMIHSPDTHTYTGIVATWNLITERWEEWGDCYPCAPTHWMPLPPPPAA